MTFGPDQQTQLASSRTILCVAMLVVLAMVNGLVAAAVGIAAVDPVNAAIGPFCTVDDCDGQPANTGGDSCDDTTTFELSIGDLQLVCGDNTPAGGQGEECSPFATDPVWWESFTLDECADVIIDFCCTETIPPTFYSVLSKDCPGCNLIYPTTGEDCHDDDDCADRPYSHCNEPFPDFEYCLDYGFGDRGPRECPDGNPSVIWRGLGPGTYYYPIHSCDDADECMPLGNRGPYQIHIEVLPISTEGGGCCFPFDPGPILIEAAHSIRTHGDAELELAIDLNASAGIEPRRGGPRKVTFDMDTNIDPGTVEPGNIQITCTLGPAPNVVAVSLAGTDVVVVEIDQMANLDCCEFAFAGVGGIGGGPVNDTYRVRGIEGDINLSGAVTGADPLLVKPHFGEVAGLDLAAPRFDYDLSGGVTGSDFALIKPRLGDLGAACPAAAGPACTEVACRGQCELLGGWYLGDGVECGDGTICQSGACCLDAGRRCEVLTSDECLAKGGSFDGPGQDCDPDCVCEPVDRGADACDELGDAVPIPSDGTVITFAGNTTFATVVDCPLLAPDLTWWEKIEVDECVDLTIDFCCTPPGLAPLHKYIYPACPCEGSFLGFDSYGGPCGEDDGNGQVFFRGLPAGTYYYPIHACLDEEECVYPKFFNPPTSRLGPYRMHVRAEPAELQGCCLPGAFTCEDMCQPQCLALGGVPLRFGEACPGGGEEPCATGACCFGHDDCEDLLIQDCLGMGGTFLGSVSCEDGPCIDNDDCEDAVLLECNTLNNASNLLATQSDEPPFLCHGWGLANVWFKFVATHTTANISTCESMGPADDSIISLYRVDDPDDPCNSLVEIGCEDDSVSICLFEGFLSELVYGEHPSQRLEIGETYYIQLGAWTEADRGNYQLRITCPAFAGACCYELNGDYVCDDSLDVGECEQLGGRFGGDDTQCNDLEPLCGSGACCNGEDCTIMALEVCQACADCIFVGDGTLCDEPANPCLGACCTGDGSACMTTSESGCLDDPPGGLGGALWTRYLLCNDPGIDCTNADPDICTQPAANCHLSDQQGHGANGTLFVQSDRSQFTQSRVADSFVPTAMPITSECWWGVYANFQLQNPNCTTNDSFRVTYYMPDGPNGLPNTIIRQSTIGATKSLTGNIFVNNDGDILPEWEYRGNNHPNAAVTVGECTWFEVTNDTGFQNCRWYWATSGDGDGLSVIDANHVNGYEVGEEATFDMAWCANVAIEADDCN